MATLFIRKLLWFVAFLSAACGAAIAVVMLKSAESAPQQCAAAAMALAMAVIPYCLARAVSELLDES